MNITSFSIASAWEESIQYILSNPIDLVYTQRGVKALEIIGMEINVDNPGELSISSKYIFGDLFINEYCRNIIAASQGEHSIYSRIVKKNELALKENNQLLKVINLLKRENNSRRAIISLWDAEKDIYSTHPPCVCTIQYLLRNNKLNTIAYFRSNDAWMAALPDMISMRELSIIIADKLGVKLGKYKHYAASFHLYEPDIIPAKLAFKGSV